MTDIVDWLRSYEASRIAKQTSEAADTIEALRAENKRLLESNEYYKNKDAKNGQDISNLVSKTEKLRAALKPFAVPDWCEYATFTGYDLRRAAAALKETGDD